MNRKWSLEARLRLKQAYQSPERNPFFGRKHTNETKRKMSLSQTGKKHTVTKALLESIRARTRTEKFRKLQSEKLKKLWQNPEFRDRHALRNIKRCQGIGHSASMKTPNKIEQQLGNILEELFPGKYKYNDGWFMLGRKFPDFVNINGKKNVIEFFGNYWHSENKTGRTREQEENFYMEHYKKYGFECLIVWDYELNNRYALLEKLKEFSA